MKWSQFKICTSHFAFNSSSLHLYCFYSASGSMSHKSGTTSVVVCDVVHLLYKSFDQLKELHLTMQEGLLFCSSNWDRTIICLFKAWLGERGISSFLPSEWKLRKSHIFQNFVCIKILQTYASILASNKTFVQIHYFFSVPMV